MAQKHRDWRDEFNQRSLAAAEASSNPSQQAMARLVKMSDGVTQKWVNDELARGTSVGNIVMGLTDYYANHVASIMFYTIRDEGAERDLAGKLAMNLRAKIPRCVAILREEARKSEGGGDEKN